MKETLTERMLKRAKEDLTSFYKVWAEVYLTDMPEEEAEKLLSNWLNGNKVVRSDRKQ